MKKTYKQIVGVFELLADAHAQVNSFVNNAPLQINGNELIFPVVALYPASSNIQRNSMFITFKFFVMDLLTDGYENERDVLSDTLQIGNDFIIELYSNEDKYGFSLDEDSVTMEPFAENFNTTEGTDINDDCAGWYFSFIIEVQNDFDECILPFN